MKTWVEFGACKGKTIAKLSRHHYQCWVMLFTDDTWSSISANYGYTEDYELMSEQPEPCDIYRMLLSLGIIDAAEAARLSKEAQEAANAKQLERELAEFERLKAKFGDGNIEMSHRSEPAQ